MRFMVSISFASQDLQGAVPLIPQEQAHIKELRQQELVEAIHISADRSKVWIIMPGNSADEVQERLKEFPLYSFMQAEITLLV